MKLQDYATFRARPAAALLLKATVPTGHYSGSRPINVGANRWSFTVATPVTFSLTKTYVDPHYASIELMPSVTFYTANDEVFGPARRQTQAPLFMLEGHVTKNLSAKTFVSLDALAVSGGATKTDGISNDDYKVGLGLGGTIATMITPTLELRGTYGASVARNNTGPGVSAQN